jgi:hypothetical protein
VDAIDVDHPGLIRPAAATFFGNLADAQRSDGDDDVSGDWHTTGTLIRRAGRTSFDYDDAGLDRPAARSTAVARHGPTPGTPTTN